MNLYGRSGAEMGKPQWPGTGQGKPSVLIEVLRLDRGKEVKDNWDNRCDGLGLTIGLCSSTNLFRFDVEPGLFWLAH